MGNNRFNKPAVPDYTPKGVKKEVELTLDKEPCLICKKVCHAYGRHEDGHTCSSKCEKLYVKPEGERHAQMVSCFAGRVYVPE